MFFWRTHSNGGVHHLRTKAASLDGDPLHSFPAPWIPSQMWYSQTRAPLPRAHSLHTSPLQARKQLSQCLGNQPPDCSAPLMGYDGWMYGNDDMCKPMTTETQAKEIVQGLYGLEVVSVTRMDGYDDQNYRIEVSEECNNPHIQELSRDGYTLKVMNTLDSKKKDFIDGTHQVLRHLREKGFYVPELVPNICGNLWSSELLPVQQVGQQSVTHERCVVRLFTFLPGTTIYHLPTRCYYDTVYQWGKLLARLQLTLEEYSCPSVEDRNTEWCVMNALDLRCKFGVLEKGSQKQLCWTVLEEFEAIYPKLKKLPHVLIHGDFNEQNVVALEKPPEGFSPYPNYVVYGILDFGDLHKAPIVCDLAVMLAYAVLTNIDMIPTIAVGYALAGYLTVRSISNEELSYLKACIGARICQSLILGAIAHRRDPANNYVLTTARTGWSALYQMWTTPDDMLYMQWKTTLANRKIDTRNIDFTNGKPIISNPYLFI